jgi:hypothetical protein
MTRSLAAALGYILAAAVMLSIAYYEQRVSEVIKMILVIVGIAAAIIGIIQAIDWVTYRAANNYQLIKRAAAISPASLLVERIQGLDIERLDIANQLLLTADAIPGSPGPAILYRSPFGDIPGSFIKEYFKYCNNRYAAPVSTWTEGTKKNQYARALINTLIYMGFADHARGPNPPKWIDQAGAIKYYGVSING